MYIAGPSGKIECQLDQVADGGKGAIAVLCHPHPLYGGSMHDRVLSTVAHRFIEWGSPVRFNFVESVQVKEFRQWGGRER